MKFVLASHNENKLKEMSDILTKLNIDVELLDKHAPQPEETGKTFLENARIKAICAMKYTGMPAMADDSGLCVDALDGAPSIYSARYCEGTDKDRNEFLLSNMKDKEDRNCYFVCAICCIFPDGNKIEAVGKCYGKILREERGKGGFGYDPIFYVEQFKKTFAELSIDEKNKISHRACALKELEGKLKKYLKELKNNDYK